VLLASCSGWPDKADTGGQIDVSASTPPSGQMDTPLRVSVCPGVRTCRLRKGSALGQRVGCGSVANRSLLESCWHECQRLTELATNVSAVAANGNARARRLPSGGTRGGRSAIPYGDAAAATPRILRSSCRGGQKMSKRLALKTGGGLFCRTM
jgi:hypothetical protein